jgi:hypothetical protein
LISGTRFQAEHAHTDKLCDYILYWQPLPDSRFLAAIELKTGSLKMNDIARQLQAGATLAESLLPDACEPLRFAAVLAKRQRMHPDERKVLDRRMVLFRKVKYPIRVLNCGAGIESAFPR